MPVVEVPAAAPPPSAEGLEQEHGLGDRETADAVTVTVTVAAVDASTDANRASYGPVSTGGLGRSADAGHRAAYARTGHAPAQAPAPGPVRRGPAGGSDGVLGGGASVLDGGASRHGDTHAVTPCHRVPLRLVPGGAVRSDAARTRDRRRDVPVFPG
ncbi:hypothetical protein [Streptomyces sp. NPDC060002]|uniref:hypothetical protein n=1 Tax=Streptomyces sp. NPDC060002 TaxID=3347033 RepID=UPI003688B53E